MHDVETSMQTEFTPAGQSLYARLHNIKLC